MSTLYISEYQDSADDREGRNIQAGREPSVATQAVTFSTATASAAFSGRTLLVRIYSSADCHLSFGTAPTATTSHAKMKADTPEYFGVIPEHKVSAVNA